MSARFPITVILGSGIMIWGLYMFAKAAEFVLHSSKAAGQIVSIEREDTDDGTMERPVFVFTDAAGIMHTCRAASRSTRCFFIPGEHISVLYDGAVPARAVIDSFSSIWFFPCAFTGMGVFFIASHYRWMRKVKLEKESHGD